MGEKLMRILHIITGLNVGGAEKLLLNLSYQQLLKKDEVQVVFLKTEGLLKDDFIKSGIKVTKLDIAGFGIFKAFFKLIVLIKKNKFDVIHTHLPHAAFIGRFAAKICGCKNVVNTIHNTYRWYLSNDFKYRCLKRIDTYLNNQKNSNVIAISKAVKNFTAENGKKVDTNKIHIIHNAIYFDEVTSKASVEISQNEYEKMFSNSFVVCNIGTMEYQKGQIVLLKAINRLIKEKNMLNIKCIIIGGSGKCESILEEYIKTNGLEDNVFLLGVQKNPYKYLRRSNLFVMSSIYEGFGIVVLEAYLCGIPVLSTNVDGLNEILINNKTGITIEKENDALLSEEILKFHNNFYNADSFIKNAYNYVKSFNIIEYEIKVKEIYSINL
ncbi:MAG: glycosyltransferase [Clostridia bacterium]|nr:glycosyltransferase [Clostridia bacterium]